MLKQNKCIEKFTTFYPAEEYHQDYYKKNPIKYTYYRGNSGRDAFLDKQWNGKTNDLHKRLTPLQYRVTQEGATEKPFEKEGYGKYKVLFG